MIIAIGTEIIFAIFISSVLVYTCILLPVREKDNAQCFLRLFKNAHKISGLYLEMFLM